jgi:hypothetical protein
MAGALLSIAAVVAGLAWAVRRVRSDAEIDQAFGLAATAMLLVSPIAWEHYFLILLVPLAVVWSDLPPSWPARGLFLTIVAALWLGPRIVWTAFDLGGKVATPIEVLTLHSYHSYALLGLYALGLIELRS